tara:strand:- start:132 stop:350 length:219 start_codon:yes stop_codon:yes gene_type:complete
MKKIHLIIFFFFLYLESFSQCAMCKAIAESDPDGKEAFFEGLNSGILYLMAIPYILLTIALVYIYLNRKKVL